MKKNTFLTAILGIALFASCSKDVEEVQYTPSVKIQFAEGGDSSIVTVQKGVMEHPIKIDVSGTGEVIRLFEIYEADTKTGNKGALIEGTVQAFPTPESAYSTTFTISGLTESKCIKIVVTDALDQVYEKNLLIKITPAVVFSAATKMETVENYYGPYYASWLSGRAYMRNTQYAQEIDFSLGDVVIPSEGADPVPALVNPSLRTDYSLLTAAGLQNTKFALTALTRAEYNDITQVDASPISSLADPTLDVVLLEAGNVYLFKTANGKKGLISVTALTTKTGTIENVSGQWEEGTTYHELTLTTKTVFP